MYDWNGNVHSLFNTRSVIVEWAQHLLQTKAGSAEDLLRNFPSEWDIRGSLLPQNGQDCGCK